MTKSKNTKKINQLNAKGRKEGLWITTTKDGCTTTVNYVDGKKEGLLETYDNNGERLRQRTNYVKNKKHGLHETYYVTTGALCERIEYTNGKRNGRVEYYHNNGQLHAIRTDVMDVTQGPWIYYHENGELAALAYCIDDEFQGIVSQYNNDGSLQYVRYYHRGQEIKTLYNMYRVKKKAESVKK